MIKLLTTEEYYPAMYIVPIYVYYHLFGIIGMFAINQMIHAEKMLYILPASIISIILNITLNLLLIPKYGAIGAGIATAISAFGANCSNLYYGNKLYPISHWRRQLAILFITVIIFTIPIYPIMLSELNFMKKILLKLIIILFFITLGIYQKYISVNQIINIGNRIFQRKTRTSI